MLVICKAVEIYMIWCLMSLLTLPILSFLFIFFSSLFLLSTHSCFTFSFLFYPSYSFHFYYLLIILSPPVYSMFCPLLFCLVHYSHLLDFDKIDLSDIFRLAKEFLEYFRKGIFVFITRFSSRFFCQKNWKMALMGAGNSFILKYDIMSIQEIENSLLI